MPNQLMTIMFDNYKNEWLEQVKFNERWTN